MRRFEFEIREATYVFLIDGFKIKKKKKKKRERERERERKRSKGGGGGGESSKKLQTPGKKELSFCYVFVFFSIFCNLVLIKFYLLNGSSTILYWLDSIGQGMKSYNLFKKLSTGIPKLVFF